ncbi:unnamed protein product [Ceutorhynchus assimilis]|uniref:Uncharacterized protein n=1 Tax=Ceutorhynchus assimilis TaxID=467358 RepID=A0A9N9MSR8_9CUCU|nr:unnamed protein product [Ceutorhynchus assimilis]
MRGKSNCNVDSHDDSANAKKKSIEEKNCHQDALTVASNKRSHEDKDYSPEEDSERYKEGHQKPNTNQVKTYNRVMSNHRSVTKPKDVKYKRINKAKSKSLEELRGRLKNWVEQGSKIPGGIPLEHSQSYA